MPFSNSSRIVEFDADAAVRLLQDNVEGVLYSVIEFDDETFNILYVDDNTLAFYDDKDHMLDHFDKVHSHVYLDFTEIDLFTDAIFPIAEEVEYITTSMDYMKIVRLYRDRQGLFVALDRDEPVQPLVDAVFEVMQG